MYGEFYYGGENYAGTGSMSRVSVVRKAIDKIVMLTKNVLSVLTSKRERAVMGADKNKSVLTAKDSSVVLTAQNNQIIL